MRNKVKICPGCSRHLWVALPSSLEIIPVGHSPVAFNRKRDSDDGLQPWCRTCDWHGKATLDEAWNRFRAVLAKEPASALEWTKDSYLELLGDDPTCNWCGTRCREWSVGHWIDRQTSDYGHVPSNSVVCCTPCNFHKGHKPYSSHELFLRSIVKSCPEFPHGMGRHPWGKIPWNDYPSSSKKFRRAIAPDLSAHVVASAQMSLGGFGF